MSNLEEAPIGTLVYAMNRLGDGYRVLKIVKKFKKYVIAVHNSSPDHEVKLDFAGHTLPREKWHGAWYSIVTPEIEVKIKRNMTERKLKAKVANIAKLLSDSIESIEDDNLSSLILGVENTEINLKHYLGIKDDE